MAKYRAVQMSFWTDPKVVDDFTPEDKYFYLYLMTNPHTNLCGCYELSMKLATDETGYTRDTIEKLLDRMEKVHDVIRYNRMTKEVLILNWGKHNWTKSKDFVNYLEKEISDVKTPEFADYLRRCMDGDTTVVPRWGDGGGTTVSVISFKSNNGSVLDLNNKDLNTKDLQDTTLGEKNKVCNSNKQLDIYKEQREEIIRYLNEKIGARYKSETYETRKAINGRLEEGYTVSDFVEVIDKKVADWQGTDMEKYLRPDTLFRQSKFESYLNQKETKGKKERDLLDEWRNA